MKRFATSAEVVCLVLALVFLTACTQATQPAGAPEPTGTTPPAPSAPRVNGTRPDAGFILQGDVVIVRGWLSEVDIEGGTWIVDGLPPTSSAQHPTLAVLVDGKVKVADLAKYRTSASMGFVEIRGRKGADVSVRMAGPEVLVDEVIAY